jgi:hypothetical protein
MVYIPTDAEWKILEKRHTSHEWGVNYMDGEDIRDTDHFDKLSEIPDSIWSSIDCDHVQLEVARVKWTKADGMTDRAYAQTTMENGAMVLDDDFEGGGKVPRKLHGELAKRQRRGTHA